MYDMLYEKIEKKKKKKKKTKKHQKPLLKRVQNCDKSQAEKGPS